MKVILWLLGGVIVLTAVGYGVYQVVIKDDNDLVDQNVQTGEQADAGATREACDIFTEVMAKQVLGEGARKGELPTASAASTDDISVTNCLYEADDPNSKGILTANVLVRGGKTAVGKTSNKVGFEGNQDRSNFEDDGISDGTEYQPTVPITDLSEAAFYDPDFNQVNVLVDEGTYWLIIQADGINTGVNDSGEAARTLAELLVDNI